MSIHDKRCVSCRYYDGELCTKDLNNLDYDYAIDTMYKAPFETCEDYDEANDYEEDENE